MTATEVPEDLIAEAITEAFGERCPDFDPDCHCCKVWAQYDALKATPEVPEDIRETAERIGSLAFNGCEAVTDEAAQALLTERNTTLERAAVIAEAEGNFGDYKREELTVDYGQPRFDITQDIAAAIRKEIK